MFPFGIRSRATGVTVPNRLPPPRSAPDAPWVRRRTLRRPRRRGTTASICNAGRIIAPLIAAVALPAAASAQSVVTLPPPPFTLPFLPSPSGLWTVTVGAGGELKPDFEGAKTYMLSPVPIFSVRRAGTPDRFRSPRDGASLTLVEFDGFHAGAVGKLKGARTAANNAALTGLGDVNMALELGGFAEYYPVDWLRTRVEVRQGFGGHHGVVADVSADVIVPVFERLTWSAGPRFTFADTRATAPYFSINTAQAMASGLQMFNAKGGAHSVGAGTQVRYQINPQWEVHSYLEYDRLLGSAAASPLVRLRGSANQLTVGLGASYSFDVLVP
jgi:outer membrane protein